MDPDHGHSDMDPEVRKKTRLKYRSTKSGDALPRGGFQMGAGRGRRAEPGYDAPPFELAMLAGGCASAVVDVCIYPIDTLKTRLQSAQGFRAAGGYTGLFSGVSAAAVGAVPGGALFFGTYEYSRSWLQQQKYYSPTKNTWSLDAIAACTATASCVLRTPTIVVQQRMQVG